MDRARRAGFTALIVVVMVAAARRLRRDPRSARAGRRWPPSTLVVSEVQTGGASASDEFVEVANQGAGPVDLAGLEVVYATASGSTVTRKATWTTSDDPGAGQARPGRERRGHRMPPLADVTYSGGFAATGGAIAIRLVGGCDDRCGRLGRREQLVRRGDGGSRRHPPGRASSERRAVRRATGPTRTTTSQRLVRPGGAVAAGPGCACGAGSGPSPSPTPTAIARPRPHADPRPRPRRRRRRRAQRPLRHRRPTPTANPDPDAHAESDADAHAHSNARRRPRRPRPAPRPIAEARGLADGTVVTIEGVLTTPLGALESGHGGFVQDESGGIALYLDAPVLGSWPAGDAP